MARRRPAVVADVSLGIIVAVAVVVAVGSYRSARQRRTTPIRALAHAARTALRWLRELLF